jgi:hypothetical protein
MGHLAQEFLWIRKGYVTLDLLNEETAPLSTSKFYNFAITNIIL